MPRDDNLPCRGESIPISELTLVHEPHWGRHITPIGNCASQCVFCTELCVRERSYHSVMAMLLHLSPLLPMQPRKSRPRIEPNGRAIPHVPRPFDVEERTTQDAAPVIARRMAPPPSGSRAPVNQQRQVSENVIPFAKPRAIAAMPATFSAPSNPTPTSITTEHVPSSWGPQASAPVQSTPPTWGSAALKQQPAPMPQAPARLPNATQPPPVQTAFPATQIAIPSLPIAPQRVPNSNEPTVVSPPIIEPVKVQPAAGRVVTTSRWAAFEKLGLKPPQLDHKKLSGHVVTAYRLLGFAILTIIVLALVSYLITTAFFYMSDSWVVPMAISPTDEKVVTLQAQLAERQTSRDRTAAELDQAERAIEVQQEFQAEFAKAIKSDLEGRKAALTRMYELANQAASTRAKIKKANSAYASASQKRMAEEWRAGLIDRDSMLNGKFQQAQISSSNLSLAERQAEYETRAEDLAAQTKSLEALLDEAGQTGGSMSYDVLRIKQEFEASRLETLRAMENAKMLRSALAREDKLVDALKQSSYIKAMADNAQVAFVPYSNLSNVKKGAPVYGCALTMIFCRRVGKVLELIPGEVVSKHPNRDKMLRGQMVEIKLESADSATDDVLFVGGRPLLI